MSHVDVKNLKPTTFEDEYYDEYDYYNLTDRYTGKLLTKTWTNFKLLLTICIPVWYCLSIDFHFCLRLL